MGGRRPHRPGAPFFWPDSTGRGHGPILRPARARRRRVLRNAAPGRERSAAFRPRSDRLRRAGSGLARLVGGSLVAPGANPGWVLAYLWSPLVSLEVARHGHLDGVGALCVAFAAFALNRGRALLGSIAFAMSVAVKPLPIVLLPLLWGRVSRRHLVAGFAVLLALYLPFWDRRRLPIGSVREVIDHFRFNGPIF